MLNDNALSGTCNPTMTNCVLFGNGGANTIVNNNATVSVQYSLFDASVTGYISGPGNGTATIRLAANSPAINTGDPATTTVGGTDLAGLPRFVGSLDIGALEFQDEIFTVKTGNWNDPTVWNVNRLPQPGDRARLKHTVTIPASYLGFVTTLIYDPASRLLYGAGGRLQMEP